MILMSKSVLCCTDCYGVFDEELYLILHITVFAEGCS